MTYRVIAATETDPQAPITSALMKALEANPTGIADGDAGAPRVLGKALGSTFLTGFNTTSTTPSSVINLAAMETIKVDLGIGSITSGAQLQCRFSADNGATHNSYQTLVTNATGGTASGTGVAYINLRTGAFHCFVQLATTTITNSGTFTVPASCNAFQIRNSASTISLAGIAWCFGGLQ